MGEHEQPGPTGQYPRGKIRPDDLGEINVRVGYDGNGCVAINFGTPVAWLAMPAEDARLLAASLIKQAGRAEAALRRN